MGMDLGVYTKVSEKMYDFVPGVEGFRATQSVRKILNKGLDVDFQQADDGDYMWGGQKLDNAVTTLEAKASYLIIDCGCDFDSYREVVELFRLSQEKGYIICLT